MQEFKIILVDASGNVEHQFEFSAPSVFAAIKKLSSWVYAGSHYYCGVIYKPSASGFGWVPFYHDVSWF